MAWPIKPVPLDTLDTLDTPDLEPTSIETLDPRLVPKGSALADMLRQKSGSQSSKYAQHRSHGKKVNYKIKFPRHSNDRFARFARSGVELGLKTIPS